MKTIDINTSNNYKVYVGDNNIISPGFLSEIFGELFKNNEKFLSI